MSTEAVEKSASTGKNKSRAFIFVLLSVGVAVAAVVLFHPFGSQPHQTDSIDEDGMNTEKGIDEEEQLEADEEEENLGDDEVDGGGDDGMSINEINEDDKDIVQDENQGRELDDNDYDESVEEINVDKDDARDFDYDDSDAEVYEDDSDDEDIWKLENRIHSHHEKVQEEDTEIQDDTILH